MARGKRCASVGKAGWGAMLAIKEGYWQRNDATKEASVITTMGEDEGALKGLLSILCEDAIEGVVIGGKGDRVSRMKTMKVERKVITSR